MIELLADIQDKDLYLGIWQASTGCYVVMLADTNDEVIIAETGPDIEKLCRQLRQFLQTGKKKRKISPEALQLSA